MIATADWTLEPNDVMAVFVLGTQTQPLVGCHVADRDFLLIFYYMMSNYIKFLDYCHYDNNQY